MTTPTVQLAFQGGGAKFVAMLPIADAFVEAERDGFITIKRVSGTSAGAICAALVAANADFGQVRRYVGEHGDRHIQSLVPPRLARLARKASGSRLGRLALLLEIGLLYDVAIRGRSLLNSPELTSFIRQILEVGTNKRVTTFEDIDSSRQLFISVSDVVSSRGFAHETGDLVAAIEDSCALPVLLRSFQSLADSHYVDGGLCDNLPVSYLDHNDLSPIFAIFPKVSSNQAKISGISNVLAYLMALFSASINHSVERSMTVVSKAFRFGADTDIGLLDFKQAIEKLNDEPWYEGEKRRARDRIASFSKSYGIVSKQQARVIDAVTIDQYQATLESLTEGQTGDFRCIYGQFTLKVNHDRRATSADQLKYRPPDTTIRTSHFEVLADNVRFYRASVNLEENSIIPTIWSARNLTTATDVPIRALPLKPKEAGGRVRRICLLEFVESQKYIHKGDVIELQSVYSTAKGQDMAKLNLGQADTFGFTNAQHMPIERAKLLLVYPKSLGSIILYPDFSNSHGFTETPRASNGDQGVWTDPQTAVAALEIDNLPVGAGFFANAVPS